MTKKKQSTEAAVREIRRRTRRKFSPEEKIRIASERRTYTLRSKRPAPQRADSTGGRSSSWGGLHDDGADRRIQAILAGSPRTRLATCRHGNCSPYLWAASLTGRRGGKGGAGCIEKRRSGSVPVSTAELRLHRGRTRPSCSAIAACSASIARFAAVAATTRPTIAGSRSRASRVSPENSSSRRSRGSQPSPAAAGRLRAR